MKNISTSHSIIKEPPLYVTDWLIDDNINIRRVIQMKAQTLALLLAWSVLCADSLR